MASAQTSTHSEQHKDHIADTAHNCEEHGHSHEEHNHSHEQHSEHTVHQTHSEHAEHGEHGGLGLFDTHGHAHGHSHGHSEGLEGFLDTFIHLAIEFSLLFLGMSIIMSLILIYVPQKKIEKLFTLPYGANHLAALLLAMLTPLCTFSSVPMLQALLRSKAPFSPCITFLLSSPFVSPVILGLLAASFGVKLSILYVLYVCLFALLTSFICAKLDFERYLVASHFLQPITHGCCHHAEDAENHKKTTIPLFFTKILSAIKNGFTNFMRAVPYLFTGILLGALIESFVPVSLLTKYTSADSLLAVPFAALLGLPLHIHLETIIPASKALVENGLPMSIIMAFLVGGAGVSISGLLVLKTLFRTPLLLTITGAVFIFAVIMGFIFS